MRGIILKNWRTFVIGILAIGAVGAFFVPVGESSTKKDSPTKYLKQEAAPSIVVEEKSASSQAPVSAQQSSNPSSKTSSQPNAASNKPDKQRAKSKKASSKEKTEKASRPIASTTPEERPYSLKTAKDALEQAKKKAKNNKFDDAFELASEVASAIQGRNLTESGENAEEYQQTLDEALELSRDFGEKINESFPDPSTPLIFVF